MTFILEDRAGKDVPFLAENTEKFLIVARKRPELARVSTTLLPSVAQYFVEVDRDKALSQGVYLGQVYGTLQSFMGGQFGSLSTTSITLADNGRFMSRRRGISARMSNSWASSTCATPTATRCPWRQ